MRYGRGHKEAVRGRIIATAARGLRRHGIGGLGIPALMKQAGLTHGGFYTHFRNRDELVAEAVLAAAQDTGRTVLHEGASLEDALATYLSREHLEHPEGGCVLAALGTDAVRQPAVVKRAFAAAARGFLRLIDQKIRPSSGRREPSDEALRRASMMVGAVVLARMVHQDALKDRILAAAARRSTT